MRIYTEDEFKEALDNSLIINEELIETIDYSLYFKEQEGIHYCEEEVIGSWLSGYHTLPAGFYNTGYLRWNPYSPDEKDECFISPEGNEHVHKAHEFDYKTKSVYKKPWLQIIMASGQLFKVYFDSKMSIYTYMKNRQEPRWKKL